MTKRKEVKRNPMAKALAHPLFRPRRVPSRKVYSRKRKE